MLGWDSNHEAHSIVEASIIIIFQHLLPKISLFLSFHNEIFEPLPFTIQIFLFRYWSKFYDELKKLFLESYEINDIFYDLLFSLLARMQYLFKIMIQGVDNVLFSHFVMSTLVLAEDLSFWEIIIYEWPLLFFVSLEVLLFENTSVCQ